MEKTIQTDSPIEYVDYMKYPVAILAGGFGSRLSEETNLIPKPMVEIGGKPILWHIMKIYSHFGYKEFIIALGYKGNVIKDYFLHYLYSRADRMTLDIPGGIRSYSAQEEGWVVHLLDTGEKTQISGRIRRILEYTKETTLLTYGDGLANIDIDQLVRFHKSQGTLATVTAVNPPSRFGRIQFDYGYRLVKSFDEKPVGSDDEYINGGFFVFEPEILSLGEFKDDEIFERTYLPLLAKEGQLSGFIHNGFWQCMDTLREKQLLNDLWESGKAEWKVWDD